MVLGSGSLAQPPFPRRCPDRYDAAELDRALAEALSRGAPGAASVAHILDQRARKVSPALDPVLLDDPRVRELRVTPHALDRYDALNAATSDESEHPQDPTSGHPTDDEKPTS